MHDTGRIQSAIEILETVFAFKQPADNTVNVYFRTHRYIGSKDRRFITDIIWQTLRHYGRIKKICGRAPSARIAVMILLAFQNKAVDLLFSGEKYAPLPLADEEKTLLGKLPPQWPAETEECPDWLKNRLEERDIAAMTADAPQDLRVNTLKTNRDDVLKMLEDAGLKAEKTPLSPVGIRLTGRPNITALDVFQNGLVEIQDEGSQLVSLLTRAGPGEQVIDWCAGAGGKTLALSAMMQARGTLHAADMNTKRLRDLPDRACRAGAANVIILNDYKNLKPEYDLVLVDAPCTGTGTWRRSPDARWRTTAEQSAEVVKIQAEILERASSYVKKGGRLFYITCSLDRAENEEQAQAFLKKHNHFEAENLSSVFSSITGRTFEAGPFVRLLPSEHVTDGFFAASFVRR